MDGDRELLNRDLYIFEVMVAQVAPYLCSVDSFWELSEPGTPRLTIGGCLMRRDRLQTLGGRLSAPAVMRLRHVVQQLGCVMAENVVRFEQRAHQELHARLGEWVTCLGTLSRHAAGDPAYYADKVDTRVVIGVLVDQLSLPPFRLESQAEVELETLDNNLRNRWQPGDFIWAKTWEEAYPRDRHWYLYGRPR